MERGYFVVSSARNTDDVIKLQEQGFTAIQLDLNSSESIQNAVKKLLELTNGSIYAVFNNGAYGQPGAVEDLTRATLRDQFETNLFGWLELTNLLIPIMRKQGEGRIIQNSSVLGFVAMKYRGAYNASKYAVEGLTDTLRLELQGTNIWCSLIEPGPIRSKFRQNAYLAYKKNIDIEKSAHKTNYQAIEQRLLAEGDVVPFTLPASAVLDKVIHALESRRPSARYSVTFPTYLFAFLKRVLPTRVLDAILAKV